MSEWASRGLVIGVLAGLVGAVTSGAGAQSGVAPCAPGTAAPATLIVQDLEGGPGGKPITGSATATHTISLEVDFGDSTAVDDGSIRFSAPPPATLKSDGP